MSGPTRESRRANRGVTLPWALWWVKRAGAEEEEAASRLRVRDGRAT